MRSQPPSMRTRARRGGTTGAGGFARRIASRKGGARPEVIPDLERPAGQCHLALKDATAAKNHCAEYLRRVHGPDARKRQKAEKCLADAVAMHEHGRANELSTNVKRSKHVDGVRKYPDPRAVPEGKSLVP